MKNNNISTIQNHVRSLLSKDRKNEALKYFNKVIVHNNLEESDLAKSLVILSNEYFSIRKKIINNILPQEEIQKLENNFTYRFLSLNEFLNSFDNSSIRLPDDEILLTNKGIVATNQSDFSISRLINAITESDDRIGFYLLKIDEKKIEISKLDNEKEQKALEEEIAKLEKELEYEKIRYNQLQNDYKKIKIELVNAVKPIFSDEHFGKTLLRLNEENQNMRKLISILEERREVSFEKGYDYIFTEKGNIFQKGFDGHFVVELDFWDILSMKTSIVVPTVDSNVKIKIPTEIKTNHVLRIKERGFLEDKSGYRGDMYYHIKLNLVGATSDKIERMKKIFEE